MGIIVSKGHHPQDRGDGKSAEEKDKPMAFSLPFKTAEASRDAWGCSFLPAHGRGELGAGSDAPAPVDMFGGIR